MANKKVTINPTEYVIDLDGKPLKMGDGEDRKDLTVGRALALILVSGAKSPDPLRAFLLGQKIATATEPVEIEQADVKFLEDQMPAFAGFTTLVIGQLMAKLQ